MRALLIGTIALSIFAGCAHESGSPAVVGGSAPSSLEDTPSTAPTAEQLALKYKTLRLITKEPVYVDQNITALCSAAAVADTLSTAREYTGPHAGTQINVYMNDQAAITYESTRVPYPRGSIIVKEKVGYDVIRTGEQDTFQRLFKGAGGMIKRDAGYDPKNGDWEYFYFEKDSGEPEESEKNWKRMQAGKIQSCINCHRGAALKDYVFPIGGGNDRRAPTIRPRFE